MPECTDSLEMPIALTIAGSDSGGGAGIQADLKTFSAHGVYGCTAITAITAQNTQGVDGIWPVAASAVGAQITSVLTDMAVNAIKTGMLYQPEVVVAVLESLAHHQAIPLVVDPVLIATSGDNLFNETDAGAGFVHSTVFWQLLKRAQLVTPNIAEAAQLLNTNNAKTESEMRQQGQGLIDAGLQAVLIKGGHLNNGDCVDLFIQRQGTKKIEHVFRSKQIVSNNTHGTGCTLSAAITAGLAKQESLVDSISAAKRYISQAIEQAKSQRIGLGAGPVQHFIK